MGELLVFLFRSLQRFVRRVFPYAAKTFLCAVQSTSIDFISGQRAFPGRGCLNDQVHPPAQALHKTTADAIGKFPGTTHLPLVLC